MNDRNAESGKRKAAVRGFCLVFAVLCLLPTARCLAGDLVRDHGGVVNDPSQTARIRNDAAFADALNIKKYPNPWVTWDGVAYTSMTVVPPRDGNWKIAGADGVGDAIDTSADAYAIKAISGGAGPDKTYRHIISDLTIAGGGGLHLEGGGKFTTCRDCIFIGRWKPTASTDLAAYAKDIADNAKFGLYARYCDGMVWERPYCHGGFWDGATLEDCHQNLFLQFTSRNNLRHGLVMRRCDGDGSLYLENNRGVGGLFDRVRFSRLHLWGEANGPERDSGHKYMQFVWTNSIGNVLTGQTHDEQRTQYDKISAAFTRTLSLADQFPPAGQVIAAALVPRINGPMSGMTSVADGVITFRPGAFETKGYSTIEFVGVPPERAWKAGDWFVVELEVAGDAAAVEWFGNTPFFRLGTLGGEQTDLGENVFPTAGRKLSIPMLAKADGKGLRFFGLLFPASGPDRELRVAIKRFNVRWLGQ